MAPPVFVWPVELLGSVYCDLHGTSTVSSEFEMFHATVGQPDNLQVKVSLIFSLPSPLVPEGHIVIGVAGRSCVCGADAERSAANTMIRAIRTEYNIFPADYSYIRISEQRALFNSVRAALRRMHDAYAEVEGIAKHCVFLVDGVRTQLSSWLVDNQPSSAKDLTIAVNYVMAGLKDATYEVAKEIEHCGRLVQLVVSRDAEPEELEHLDATVPMPMEIHWDHSFFLLRSIFWDAVNKLPAEATPVSVVRMPDDRFRASIMFPAPPRKISGETAVGEREAKAKLYYAVAKFVDDSLGHPIIDLHYTVWKHIETCIRRFDHKMENIWKSALKLKELFEATCLDFEAMGAVFNERVPRSDATLNARNAFRMGRHQVRATKDRFIELWAELEECKVLRSQLEAALQNNE